MPTVLGVQLSIVWASEEAFQLLFFWPSFSSALAFIYICLRDSCYPSSSQVLPFPTHMDYRSSSLGCLKCLTYFLCSGRSPRAVCLTIEAVTIAPFCRFSSTTGLSRVLRLHRILGSRQYLVIAQAHLLLNTSPCSSSSSTKVKVHERWASEEGDKASRATFPLLTGWCGPLQTVVCSDLTQSSVSSFRGHYVVFLCIKIFLHSRSIIFLFVDIRMKIFLQKSIFF